MRGILQILTEEWTTSLPGWVQALLRALLLVLPLLILVPGLIWLERRLLSWMQDRIGPNRVGPKGLLQPIADGVKLFFKEDITPSHIDRFIYFIAPAIALFPAFAIGGTLPWGPLYWLTPVADVNIGILYMLAISSLGVYGVVLAGYGSDNKYSLMGGLRASAQLISYELAMGMSLAAIVLATGSLKMTSIVYLQQQPLWDTVNILQNWFIFTPFGFISAVIFLICMVAETNRAPFDLPEAENELIAGYHTEYSSMKFAVFFMGEYAAMFVFSGVFAAIFLGGYNLLPIRWEVLSELAPSLAGFCRFMEWMNVNFSWLWFLGKCAFGICVYIWIRATLPRLRYDQLMSLGWRSLLPIAVTNFMLVALWMVVSRVYGPANGWISYFVGAIIFAIGYSNVTSASRRAKGDTLEQRGITMTDGGARRTIEVIK
ncbi:MAG: NADH-quinone oxidoreductase subunit H [Armatimonadetes bacterium]|nr:NADH-quinone oxidoreductase subunit H [Armatimonadota bacterium]